MASYHFLLFYSLNTIINPIIATIAFFNNSKSAFISHQIALSSVSICLKELETTKGL
jgi:hypothetical protein